MFLIAAGQAVRHHHLTPVVRGLRFEHRGTRPPRDPLWDHPGGVLAHDDGIPCISARAARTLPKATAAVMTNLEAER